jgi:hypothetical protein
MGAAPSSHSTAVRVVRALSERGGREGRLEAALPIARTCYASAAQKVGSI